MRIVIEIENGKTNVTVDDETVPYGADAIGDRRIGFASDDEPPPDEPEEIGTFIGD